MMPSDHRLDEARAMPMSDVALRLGLDQLRRTGGELVGACPQCGGDDRFGISTAKGVFLCRRCEAKGDQVALVQFVLGMDFRAALSWLCGQVEELTDAQIADRRRKAEHHRAKQDRIAERKRQEAIESARKIWFAAGADDQGIVRDYLAVRGIRLAGDLPAVIRFDPAARYTIPDGPSKWQVLFSGPAIITAIHNAQNDITAVHRTWIDLDNRKGKKIIPDPRKAGALLPSKKVLGSKKGGAIRLRTPRGADTMVMAEGIENTLTAMVALGSESPFAFWAGVDLGNMSGVQVAPPRHSGIPDMTDIRAFVPPPWVKRLIFVQDGDSDPEATRAKLLSGLRRAMKIDGLQGQIVHAGEDADLNDILMGSRND